MILKKTKETPYQPSLHGSLLSGRYCMLAIKTVDISAVMHNYCWKNLTECTSSKCTFIKAKMRSLISFTVVFYTIFLGSLWKCERKKTQLPNTELSGNYAWLDCLASWFGRLYQQNLNCQCKVATSSSPINSSDAVLNCPPADGGEVHRW